MAINTHTYRVFKVLKVFCIIQKIKMPVHSLYHLNSFSMHFFVSSFLFLKDFAVLIKVSFCWLILELSENPLFSFYLKSSNY